jgi:hypothetical protein
MVTSTSNVLTKIDKLSNNKLFNLECQNTNGVN